MRISQVHLVEKKSVCYFIQLMLTKYKISSNIVFCFVFTLEPSVGISDMPYLNVYSIFKQSCVISEFPNLLQHFSNSTTKMCLIHIMLTLLHSKLKKMRFNISQQIFGLNYNQSV